MKKAAHSAERRAAPRSRMMSHTVAVFCTTGRCFHTSMR